MKKSFFILLAIMVVAFAGCKTASVPKPEEISEPKEKNVHPLALISSDMSIYMSVPVEKHKDLVSKILSSIMDGVSEDAANAICSRTGKLYSGLGTVKDRSVLETAAWHTIPKFALNQFLTKKHGFEKETVYFEQGNAEKLKSDGTGFEVSFPSSKLYCFSQNLNPLLEKFVLEEEVLNTEYNNWVSQDSEDILFYITRPGQYLRSLIGQSISIGTDKIYGSLSYIKDRKNPEKYSGKYNLSFYIHMTNRRSVTVLNALLSLSFAMMGGTVSQTDEFTLLLSGIEVTDKQIIDLFTRDPITGKHYKVMGDDVIEESVKN